MLKIISSPPFDDYSKKLFFQVFGQKKKMGLDNASFVYLWTGPLSNGKPFIYKVDRSAHENPKDLPRVYEFVHCYATMIAGKKRYFNTIEEMFSLYCEFNALPKSDELHKAFLNYYPKYAKNVFDREMMEEVLEEACVNEIVVLFIKDHFRISTSDSWINPIPELSTYFNNLCDYYPNKQFIIVTSLENLNKEIIKDNCKIIPMGGDITNQLSTYMKYMPTASKMSDPKNFISLNRGSRNHRTYLVSALYGRSLENQGNINHLSWDSSKTLSSAVPYDYNKDFGYTMADDGFKKYSTVSQSMSLESYEIYTKQNDNITNFREKLENKYANSIIEFVSETSFNELSFNITEKTMHFIYGANFPIMISSPGTVDFLRNIGLDMFDDVIDHSYDTILDPAYRINAAIDLNLDILTSSNLIKTWNKHKYRIDNNISFVREGKLRDYYTTRFWNTWKDL
jgi:hypothetical protein